MSETNGRGKEGHNARGSDRGARLIDMRAYFDISQEQAGHVLGAKQSQISDWERGARPMNYAKVSTTFGVSVDWLMQLGHQMWCCTVLDARRSLVAYLLQLPEKDLARVRSARMDPALRFALCVAFLRKVIPDLISDQYLNMLTRLEPGTLGEVLRGSTYMERDAYSRFARWVELPTGWFETGDPALLPGPNLEAYYPAIEKAVSKGLTPRRLELLISAL